MADRWEYKVISLDCRDMPDRAETRLNGYGAGGWELVAIGRYSFEAIAYLKRRKDGSAAS